MRAAEDLRRGGRHRARRRHALLHRALHLADRRGRKAPQGHADRLGASRLGFGDGSTLTTMDTPFGRVGGAVCWEHYMPLMRAAYYAKGVQLWAAPTADDRESWISTMPMSRWRGAAS
nr:nitrilase-related carbon-nitrogen hydrolase [Chenggangzhangella methanolivorans]